VHGLVELTAEYAAVTVPSLSVSGLCQSGASAVAS
jgi:hypothetical protein